MYCIAELEKDFPFWSRLHGYWRTLPNFNPFTVSSEPGQDLEEEARQHIHGTNTTDTATSSISPNQADGISGQSDAGGDDEEIQTGGFEFDDESDTFGTIVSVIYYWSY